MNASASIPCPMCGSENSTEAAFCTVCGYNLRALGVSNAGRGKCARCGQTVPAGFDFCPVCGLDQRERHARPTTEVVERERMSRDPRTPGGAAEPISSPGASPPVSPGPREGGGVREHLPATERTGGYGESRRELAGPAFARGAAPAWPEPTAAILPLAAEAPASSRTPTSPGIHPARVVLVGRDGEEGQSFPVVGETLTIGREEGDVRFPDDRFMSPRHATLRRTADAFRLEDEASANGVFVQIRTSVPAYPGDLFMVGHQLLVLHGVIEGGGEQPLLPDGTRRFGTPLQPAWGRLELIGRGGIPGDHHYLRGAKVVFGREQGDILFPADPFVSREHARLRLELQAGSMAVFLEDLGSANGTYLRIRGDAELQTQDTFRVGDQILRLRVDP